MILTGVTSPGSVSIPLRGCHLSHATGKRVFGHMLIITSDQFALLLLEASSWPSG